MNAVYGTKRHPLTIELVDGTFFQHPMGTDRPPNPALFDAFTTLRYDTYVTIGVESYNPSSPGNPEGQPEDQMFFPPRWPGFGASSLHLTTAAWTITPRDPQGEAFNSEYDRTPPRDRDVHDRPGQQEDRGDEQAAFHVATFARPGSAFPHSLHTSDSPTR